MEISKQLLYTPTWEVVYSHKRVDIIEKKNFIFANFFFKIKYIFQKRFKVYFQTLHNETNKGTQLYNEHDKWNLQYRHNARFGYWTLISDSLPKGSERTNDQP